MNSAEPPTRLRAEYDARMQARIVRRVPLHYAEGANVAIDRPAHVRAASGLAWVGSKLAVIQDDANFIALVDPVSGQTNALALPAGALGKRLFDDERGNKRDKLDFESLVSATLLDGTTALLAFGSGSQRRREQIAIVDVTSGRSVRLIHGQALYAALRDCENFAGSELNIEGAVFLGEQVRLFGRGNGDISTGVVRVNATCDLNWARLLAYLDNPSETAPPGPTNVMQFELGELAGTRITFTDAAVCDNETAHAPGTMLYTGTAEASPDVVRDGVVQGSVVGIISESLGRTTARYTEIQDTHGGIARAKVEGIVPGDFERGQVYVVVDADDHRQPGELWELKFTDSYHHVFQESVLQG
ncbi:MAG: hypothetical protein H7Z40_13560 [Phycisphaerae bacterium]|nr:hypothetical protein [Gemmatimonadaceae bacterium]